MHPQYIRRTFRGRGGATDRRLPKHNAARRRPPPASLFHPNANAVDTTEIGVLKDDDDNWEDDESSRDECSDDEYALQIVLEQGDVAVISDEVAVPVGSSETTTGMNDNGDTKQETLEVEHLRRRIRNNRASMSFSAVAMANPTSYQTNVLAACVNTNKEWRSILRHYTLDDDTKKRIGLMMFELIQQSLQCGPLAGAKPGYFKRCGSDIAGIIHVYLTELVPDETDAHKTLGFTLAQSQAIQRWKQDSTKAMLSGNAPSKSVLKTQEKALKKKR